MMCPLFTLASIHLTGVIDYSRWECLKEECAWWVEAFDKCAIREIRDFFEAIDNRLHDIEEKMPHAGQFLK